jgi:polysaccharide export outer membrane protein
MALPDAVTLPKKKTMRIPTLFFLLTALLVASDSSGQFTERDPRYRLQPSDVLEVQYRYTPEYNQTASVQPDGYASLQLIGGVKLAGLTLDQAHSAILERASARLRDPELFLILKDYEKPHFVVGGEVANPGRFELRGRITAVEAIEMAGGFKAASAKHSQVVLFRRLDSATGETKILNLKQIIDAPKLQEDMVLRPGDMLLVPQNKISKIERFIKWGNFGMYWSPF